jgi:MFS family permease
LRTIGIAVVFTLYMGAVFGFGFYLFALLVTKMRENLGFEYAAIGIVTGGAQISFLVTALFCPQLANRFGGGAVIASAVVAAGMLLLLFASVQNVVQVGLVLAGLGAAAAFMVIPTVSVISRVVPFAYRSRVNGLVSSGTAYGQFVNGIVVPWILPEHGWRTIWLLMGLLTLAIAGLGYIALRLLARDAFVVEAASKTERTQPPQKMDRLVTGRNLTVWSLLSLSGMSCGPWQNYLSSFLADEHAWSMATIGQLWSIIGVVGLFSGFAAGMAADRFGVRINLAASYVILACSALLIAFHTDDWQLRGAAICFGLSFYAVYGLIPAYITKSVAPQSTTTVFAVANVFLGGGTTLGNVVGGYMPTVFGSLQSVFVAASTIACLGMAITILLQDERNIVFGRADGC